MHWLTWVSCQKRPTDWTKRRTSSAQLLWVFQRTQTHECNSVSLRQFGAVPALQSPKKQFIKLSELVRSARLELEVSSEKYVQSPSLQFSPSDNVCVCSSNPQCQPRNCAQGLNKGWEVKITGRSSGQRLCFVCAHILVHTVTVDLLTATVFKPDKKRKVWHSSAGRLVFRANVKLSGLG